MREITTPHKNIRALTASGDGITYSAAGSCDLHKIDFNGNHTTSYASSGKICALKALDYSVILADFGAPCIYTADSSYNIICKTDYLMLLPPKFLPFAPYPKYVTGITEQLGNIYFLLQNSQYCYMLTDCNKCSVAFAINTDEYCFDTFCGRFIWLNRVKSCVRMGEKYLHFDSEFSPTDIACTSKKIYLSTQSGKIIEFGGEDLK